MRINATVDSPVGPLTLVAEDDALVGLYMDGQRHRPSDLALGLTGSVADALPLLRATDQLVEYFAGERTGFDLPLRPAGTPFQRLVWAALTQIPFGTVVSYGELAVRVGRPGAARAVGLANGRNPIGIVIPCHRVVGSRGALTGYDGGLERKQQLLELEGAASVERGSLARLPTGGAG